MVGDDDATAMTLVPRSAAKADRELVDRAVEEIREILRRTLKRGMEEVGAYLLREFYDGDPSLYFSMHPSKHVSLSMLAARCESLELPVKRVFLSRAVRIAALLDSLPRKASFRALPDTHRAELLSLRDPREVEALAKRVIDKRLSSRKVRELVRARRVEPSGRGRPRIPAVLKALGAAVRLVRDEESGRLAFRKADLDALDEPQRALAREHVKVLAKRIAELERLLG